MWSAIYEVYSIIKKLQHYIKVSVLVQPSYLGTWKLEPCTSGSSNECQQRASRSTELQFPPSITSINRSLFANSRALAKSFSSVVFLVQRSRQFGLTGRKTARRSEISSRYSLKLRYNVWESLLWVTWYWARCNAQTLINQVRHWINWTILLFFPISHYFGAIFIY